MKYVVSYNVQHCAMQQAYYAVPSILTLGNVSSDAHQGTVGSVQCAVYSVQCAVFSVQCAVCSVQCAVCSV